MESFAKEVLELRKEKHHLAPVAVFHLAEIRKIGKTANRDTTVEEFEQYIKKTISKLEADKYSSIDELEFLKQYAPKMAPEAELKELVRILVNDGLNKGAIMKLVKTTYGSSADLKLVSQMVDSEQKI